MDKSYKLLDMGNSSKQGHIICGGCCDSRRGVIIVNIIGIVFAFIAAITVPVGISAVEHMDANDIFDDDYQVKQFNIGKSFLGSGVIAIVVIMAIASIAFCGIGIYGALKYKMWAIITALVFHCVGIFLNMAGYGIFGMIYGIFTVYPHCVFLQEVKNGIMSESTYEVREEQSCCCV